MADEQVKQIELGQKHLKGLKFKTSEKKEIVEEGQKKTRYLPIERALKLDDLLSQRDDGATFHIVTKDGRKYDVPKDAKNAGGDDDKPE
jgi:hypothetical protein